MVMNRTRKITPQISAGFTCIFGDNAPSLLPSRRFEMEFGGKDPLVFYLHYDLWIGMLKVYRGIDECSDSELGFLYSMLRTFVVIISQDVVSFSLVCYKVSGHED